MSNLRRRLLLDSPQYNKSEFEFGFDKVPSEVSGDKSYVHSIKGNSVKFNQKIKDLSVIPGRWLVTADSYSVDGNRITLVRDTSSESSISVQYIEQNLERANTSHKYYFSFVCKHTQQLRLICNAAFAEQVIDATTSKFARILAPTAANSPFFILRAAAGTGGFTTTPFTYIDLTNIFGTDEQIATALGITTAEIITDTGVAAFEEWLEKNIGKQDYYDYNPGTILNNKTEQVEVVGFNQWDEETRDGYYNHNTGEFISNSNYVANKNPIPIIPDAEYYLKGGCAAVVLDFWDANGNFLVSERKYLAANGMFVAPQNASAFNFAVSKSYPIPTCVNLSDTSKNGTYEPYRKTTIPLNLTSLKGKLLDLQGQPTGSSVVISPNGLAGKDNWRDYCIIEGGYITKVVKKTGEADLGDLGWSYTPVSSSYPYGCFRSSSIDKKISDINVLCGKYTTRFDFNTDKCIFGNPGIGGDTIYIVDGNYTDVTSFKTSVTGIKLVYPLETYKTYLLDTPIPLTNRVDNGGTKRKLPEDTASAVSAPFACEVAYDTINTNTNSIERVNATEEFIYDNISIDKPVKRGILTKIKGKSLVWNQLAAQFTARDYNGVELTNNLDGSYTLDGTCSASVNIANFFQVTLGHKYFFTCRLLSGSATVVGVVGQLYTQDIISTATDLTIPAVIATASGTGMAQLRHHITTNDTYSQAKFATILIDLTLMFGSGNEPSTVAEFEKLYPLSYYNYNAGTLINNTTSALETVGFNLWDEEWELGGMYSDGALSTNTDQIRTKNYIPVAPNTIYYLKTKSGISQGDVHFYDINKVHLSGSWAKGNNTFTTLSNCAYIKVAFQAGYGSTYNHDICINLSNTSRNGQYEPYWKNTVNLNITSLTGKLNGEGNSVTIVPTGLKSAGTAYDYGVIEKGKLTKIVKCIGEVDMGTLNWAYDGSSVFSYNKKLVGFKTGSTALTTKYIDIGLAGVGDLQNMQMSSGGSGLYFMIKDTNYTDATTFKTAKSGEYIYCELATPEVYILDNPVPVSLLTYKDCTVKQLPENTSTVVTAINVEVIKNQIH